MKIFTSLLIVSSLAACTAHVQSTGGAPPPRRRVVEQPPPPPPPGQPQPPPPAPPAPPAERWVELAEPQRNEDFRDFIKVGPDAGRFNRIRISVTRGTVWFEQVGVEFHDRERGKNQLAKVGRRMNAGEAMVIDLEGGNRVIHRINVYMDPAQRRGERGVYRIFAN